MVSNAGAVGKDKLKRKMSFSDIFFLSIGGQAPFLSMLTYTTAVVVLTAGFAPVVVIIGTLIVLLNGLVVSYLSRKFTSTGGYFNYAFYGLSKRLGLETGVIYTFYSVLYGCAYVAGSTFIINYLLHIPVFISFLASIVPASILMLIGIKPSAHYAIVASSLEIAVLVLMFLVSMFFAHFTFYNPISFYNPVSSKQWFSLFILGILYAIGIPTGYGSITPVSGEVKKAEVNVGRAAILVIIVGGGLMALVLYGLVDVLIYEGQLGTVISRGTPILFTLRGVFGPFTFPVIILAAISDGILATLAFMLAGSRNLYAMSLNRLLPANLTFLRYDNPLVAGMVTIVLYLAILLPLFRIESPFNAFLTLGALAGMGNLFIHISANFSLIKINIDAMIRRLREIIVGSVAQILSFSVLLLSIINSENSAIGYVFLGFVIVAFIYTEMLGMTKAGKSIFS
ncbi:MAG: APC family permease [Candidatus Thermoplasmatota archaeon]|jgi:amino acid transporter|nr:APC family permease [Candidatus Thermoplasmatota archaeon]MCL5681292.1 APC family permease [Candidatus Thermoplasmatota archaeon]